MEPGEIKKLDEVVVNRIAAGEIIQRPANALKELLENSLDAKSTNIQIVVKSGGLKYLQIQDNGTGIRKEDLEIVCERFTTSKLTTFEDLSTMTTYGFRGEALSSISHVAHLTLQTKTRNEKCAYKASYSDGKLIGKIQPIAGNQGTQITIEDLFYNTPQRKAALKSPAEELQRIADVLSKYAIHNSHAGITLKKYGENNILKTNSNSNVIENIRIVYGKDIAKELLEPVVLSDDGLQMKMNAYITKPNYSTKKGTTFLLFVNHRLVESAKLLSQINDVYSVYLPKGNHPFVYISLEMATQNVDVNVHPTKHEVHFMYEDEIIEKIKETIAGQLLGCNESRTFYTQTRLISATQQSITKSNIGNKKGGKSNNDGGDSDDSSDDACNINFKPINVYAKNMIRTDFKEQKLEKFFGQTILIPSQSKLKLNLNDRSVNDTNNNDDAAAAADDDDDDDDTDDCIENDSKIEKITSPSVPEIYKIPEIIIRKKTKLTSILNMRKRLEQKTHRGLRKLISEFTFVGIIDPQFALIQFETKLFLCDTQRLCEELFYQILLYEFENFGKITFDPPLAIYDLATLALRNEDSGWTADDGPIEELSDRIKEILIEKSALLKQYYNLCISSDGLLESIPLLLDKHKPFMGYLPMYILRLSTEVNWDVEENCFDTFSRETAKFYSKITKKLNFNCTADGINEQWKWTTEYCIYPAIKKYLLPQNGILLNRALLQIGNLSELYKVFERC